MKPIPLFVHEGADISGDDFTRALKDLGVRDRDVAFVHADIGAFGKLAVLDRNILCRHIVDSLMEAAPGMTLTMPTFTYAFCKDGIFDPDESPSEVGVLTEFFRHEKGVVRSPHPIFSIAAEGPRTEEMTRVGTDSFGENSFFAHLHNANGIIIFFGASFERATFAHYIEQMHGVPYRFLKTFTGIVRAHGVEEKVSSTYLVRPLDQDVETNLIRLENALRAQNVLKEVRVGNGAILAVRAKDMFSIGSRMLDENIYAFLKNPPKSYTG